MPPFDSTLDADLPMTTDEPASSHLSAGQIAALVRTVVQALARGQSVMVMSDGRMLARYLPTSDLPTPAETAEDGSDGSKDGADRKR